LCGRTLYCRWAPTPFLINHRGDCQTQLTGAAWGTKKKSKAVRELSSTVEEASSNNLAAQRHKLLLSIIINFPKFVVSSYDYLILITSSILKMAAVIQVNSIPVPVKQETTELSSQPVRLFPIAEFPVMTQRCVSGSDKQHAKLTLKSTHK
jgi:hypothetical protein